MTNDLSEKSISYYEESNIYQKFSQAEDALNVVESYLVPYVTNKTVLDLGCGNGKYLKILRPLTTLIYGIDLSEPQLKLIKKKDNLICADAVNIPLCSNSIDVIYSCWMFGTITGDNKRYLAMNEAKRILKPGGLIILIENSNSGEFEFVRGRISDPLERTKNYNDWLLSQGFVKKAELNTYFDFYNAQEANQVFRKIWKERLVGVLNSRIEHNISVFEWSK